MKNIQTENETEQIYGNKYRGSSKQKAFKTNNISGLKCG